MNENRSIAMSIERIQIDVAAQITETIESEEMSSALQLERESFLLFQILLANFRRTSQHSVRQNRIHFVNYSLYIKASGQTVAAVSVVFQTNRRRFQTFTAPVRLNETRIVGTLFDLNRFGTAVDTTMYYQLRYSQGVIISTMNSLKTTVLSYLRTVLPYSFDIIIHVIVNYRHFQQFDTKRSISD